MEKKLVRKIFNIDGMTCTSCEMRIENALRKLEGIEEVKAIYSSSNVYVTYDVNKVGAEQIARSIERLDYKVKNGLLSSEKQRNGSTKIDKENHSENKANINQLVGIGIILIALYMIIDHTIGFNFFPQVNQSMGYGILFVVGLLTSLHCIAMCGGINLSVCVRYNGMNEGSNVSKLKPSALYNLGRVISYTIIGGIVGALGSVVSFSGTAKGVVAILSGLFMVIMGLNMLNIFPWLRKFNPRMPKIFGNKIHSNAGDKGPLVVGLLNGLMPCGPLQAMQLYALGTGSFAAGAISMFLFSLGTVPLMFGFGAVSSFLGRNFTHKMMKVSAVLVMVLGIIMFSRGLNLSGYNIAFAAPWSDNTGDIAKIENGVQVINTKLESGKYPPIVVQKGIPVKWTIQADKSSLNGCNNKINISEFNIENKPLVPGDNVIEFTPQKEGNFVYSCWMGMISSNIKVVSDVTKEAEKISSNTDNNASLSLGGGCCSAGSKATKFAGGKIPVDEIAVAKIQDGIQTVSINVNDEGYSPAVIVMQKGIKTNFIINGEKLNSCNNKIIFPELGSQMTLKSGENKMEFTPENDFSFRCWMGMLNGVVKVVDDINKIDINAIKKEVTDIQPSNSGGSSGGGCCG